MAFPITPVIDLFNSFICAFCSYQIYQSFRRDRSNAVLKYFSQGYLALIFSYLLFSLPRLLAPHASFYQGVGFILAQAGLYIALAYFAKITAFFINQKLVQRVFWLVLTLAAVNVALSFIYFTYPQYNTSTGITTWDFHPAVGITSVIIIAGVLVPTIILYFRRGLKSNDRIVKVRALLIAAGLALLVITAVTYYTATKPITALASDLFSLLSFLVIFLGVVYKRNLNRDTSITNTKLYADSKE